MIELMNELKYCPICGKPSFARRCEESFRCGDCGFELFLNAATAVALLLECDNHILFTIRAKEPDAGLLDLPGGFVDYGETAEQALHRELNEELGVSIDPPAYFVSYPNRYTYAGITYNTVDFFYTQQLVVKPELTASDDVSSFTWIDKQAIPMQRIAFTSVRNALRDYLGGKS